MITKVGITDICSKLELNNPIKKQNPVAKKHSDDNISQFSFAKNTFNLGGDGRVIYDAVQSNGKPLPLWISFLVDVIAI